MEIECVTELRMHQIPRKRPRLGWDVAPQQPEAQLGLFCGQEVGLTSYATSRMLSDNPSSLYVKDLAQNVSPPLRADDEEGHYMFELGENLTSRYKILSKMGEGTFGQVLECWDRERKEMVAIKVIRGIKKDGTCIVHHLFGHEVVRKINEMYCDSFLTAHFEVPGEMFSLAMEAKRRGMGVVGSTQNILDFIKERVQEALNRNVDVHLQFVLGPESGMVTSIVVAVRKLLCSMKSDEGAKVTVEIVFPVSSESVTRTRNSTLGETGDLLQLHVIPGVASGEGCSLHGGCASCPYMKMNSLSSLLKVCRSLPHDKDSLSAYAAGRFSLQTPNGKLIADVGCEPILHETFSGHKETAG